MEMWFSEFHTPDVKHSIRVNRQLFSRQSDYQRIDIFETPEFGRVLTLDGNVMLTERDEFIYDEEQRIETLWKSVQQSGSAYLDNIFDYKWFYYITKESGFSERIVFSPK